MLDDVLCGKIWSGKMNNLLKIIILFFMYGHFSICYGQFRQIENSSPTTETRTISLSSFKAAGNTVTGDVLLSGWSGTGYYWYYVPQEFSISGIYFTFVNALKESCEASYNGVKYACRVSSENFASGWTWRRPNKEFRQHTYSASPGERTGRCVRCFYSFAPTKAKITVSGVSDNIPSLKIALSVCNSHIKADVGFVDFEPYAHYCEKSLVVLQNAKIEREVVLPGYCRLDVVNLENANGGGSVRTINVGDMNPGDIGRGSVRLTVNCFNGADVNSVSMNHNGNILLTHNTSSISQIVEQNEIYNVTLESNIMKQSNQSMRADFSYKVLAKKAGSVKSNYVIYVSMP